ncbi:hypothetical protein [Opitutus sp. GAS368]|nr:hypothetical protein [Opitutus sp. GAS368]
MPRKKTAREIPAPGVKAARLQWFYARSEFYDGRYLLHPVGIER